MNKIPGALKSFTVLLFFIAGIVLLWAIFFWGVTKACELMLPLLIKVSAVLIMVFLFCILPLSFFNKLHPYLSTSSMLMSRILSATTWMFSFLFIFYNLGFWGIFFFVFFQFLAPIALIGAVLKGLWSIAGNLLLWIGFTYGMRFYSVWLIAKHKQVKDRGTIIDVEGKGFSSE
jgi:hypothetical protein